MLHTVIFIGRSGCGKGTQASLLRDWVAKNDMDKRKILYVETGEKFRHFVRGNSYSSQVSNAIYERDERQPNFLGAYMWSEVLIEELDKDMHIFFDGVARSRPEAEMLTTALRFYGRERPVVVNMNVSRKWSEEKLLKRHREDDVQLAKIDKRLDWFDTDVMPAIEYFNSTPYYRVLDINGEQTIEEVHKELLDKYEK